MVALAPMNTEEFAAYVRRTVPEYARDKAASGQWSEEASLALAEQEFEGLLPQGLATPDNYLFTVRDGEAGASVGMLWYATQERAGRPIAFVYDVLVEPQYQRRGFGTRIFEALEAEVGVRGLSGIALHVFGHNEPAKALYSKLGYRTTSISMFKAVPGAGT